MSKAQKKFKEVNLVVITEVGEMFTLSELLEFKRNDSKKEIMRVLNDYNNLLELCNGTEVYYNSLKNEIKNLKIFL